MREKIRSGILGAAVADALGVPVEFRTRQELAIHKVTDMRGNGTYGQPEGTWSDDTSMTLATIDSLTRGLDSQDLMKRFSNWLMNGEYTPFGTCFDVGNTTRQAILRFQKGKRPLECGGTGKNDNGNGSLMRILPISYYLLGRYGYDADDAKMLEVVHQLSALTHRHIRSQMACGIYVMITITLLKEGNLKYAIHHGIDRAISYYEGTKETRDELHFFDRLRKEKFGSLPESEIKSSGYVIDTLEAAIWCLLTTHSYKECVLKAVNLGEDTDTVAAVVGGIAGIAYGMKSIPAEWLQKLRRREYIEELCGRFADAIFKENLKLLLPFETYLLTATRDSCCTPESAEKKKLVYAFAYPEYTKEINEFIRMVENSCFWSYHYIAILNERGLECSEELVDAIDTADFALACAILTAYIRQERFHEGLIATAVEQNVFFMILNRLKAICTTDYEYVSETQSIK